MRVLGTNGDLDPIEADDFLWAKIVKFWWTEEYDELYDYFNPSDRVGWALKTGNTQEFEND